MLNSVILFYEKYVLNININSIDIKKVDNNLIHAVHVKYRYANGFLGNNKMVSTIYKLKNIENYQK